MSEAKQKKQLIALLILAPFLLASLYYAIRNANSTTAPVSGASAFRSAGPSQDLVIERGRGRGKKSVSLLIADPTIHLDKLAEFDPGAPLNARNMFSFETVTLLPGQKARNRSSSGSDTGTTEEAKTRPVSSGGPQGPLPLPPVAINLKFYGIKVNWADKKRQGFFTEGEEMYLASEGDLVANRYRILKVSDSYAEVEDVNSKSRRQLPMAVQ